MPHDFKHTSEKGYLTELMVLLQSDYPDKGDYPEYEELMNEFMEFCEVSGSGK